MLRIELLSVGITGDFQKFSQDSCVRGVSDEKLLLRDLSLSVDAGQVHVCMGPNGSGKSSLAQVILGHPAYVIRSGKILFEAVDITELSPDKRARRGIFLSMQQPYEIPGVLVSTVLREAFRALHPGLSSAELLDLYLDRLAYACNVLKFDKSFLDREIHVGFSGGEKKRCEMVQLLVLRPKLAILDEIDSGLDIDSLDLVARALQKFRELSPDSSLFIITHRKKILEYIMPDVVHVMQRGTVVVSSGVSLLAQIERHGFQKFV